MDSLEILIKMCKKLIYRIEVDNVLIQTTLVS